MCCSVSSELWVDSSGPVLVANLTAAPPRTPLPLSGATPRSQTLRNGAATGVITELWLLTWKDFRFDDRVIERCRDFPLRGRGDSAGLGLTTRLSVRSCSG